MPKSNSNSTRPAWVQKAADLVACLKHRDAQFEKFCAAAEKAQAAAHELDDLQQEAAWSFLQMSPQDRHSFEAILAIVPSQKATNILRHQVASQKLQQQTVEKPVRSSRQETTNS